jgi:hypothetical protein
MPLEGQLEDASPLPSSAFYRVRQTRVSDPFDTDGDGIDDVWELRFRRPGAALNPNDANADHTGNGTPDFQDYLNSLPLTAWFASSESFALSYGGAYNVQVRFTRAVTGAFAYDIGGDAVAGKDYQPLNGQVLLTNSASTSIPIQITPSPSLRGPRSIVLTLKSPGSNVVSRIAATPTEGLINLNRYSSHVITIRDADQGLYAGTLSFYSQTTRTVAGGQPNVTIVPAPPVAPSTFQMALRSGVASSQAVVEMPECILFPSPLSIPVTLAGNFLGFTSPSPVSGNVMLAQLQNRTLARQFEFSRITFTNQGAIFEAECRITLNGLTASGAPRILTGIISASRIDP